MTGTKELEYIIPINSSEEELKEYNERYGTNFKTMEKHIEETVVQILDALYDFAGEQPFLYVGDSIGVKVIFTYNPEDK